MPAPSGKAAIPTSGRIERQLAHNGAGWAFTDCLPAMGAAPAAPSKRLPSPCDSARPSVPALPLATPNTRPNSTIRERSVTPQLGDLTGGTVLASPTSQFAKEQLFWPSPRDWIKPPKGFVSSPRDAAKLDGPVRQGPPSSRRTRKDSSAQASSTHRLTRCWAACFDLIQSILDIGLTLGVAPVLCISSEFTEVRCSVTSDDTSPRYEDGADWGQSRNQNEHSAVPMIVRLLFRETDTTHEWRCGLGSALAFGRGHAAP
eukprot:1523486-Prymnesium_polylepis.1